MKARWKEIFQKESALNAASSLLAVFCGLLFALLLLLISNPNQAFQGFMMLLQGGFTDGRKGMGEALYYAVPVIMTGLAVGFAFRTGLFNIGVSGQFTVGAFAAVYVGVKWTFLPSGVHWLVALAAALAAGALWGGVVGFLKAFFRVNEVIASIMTNYLAMYMVNLLTRSLVYDRIRNQSLPVAESARLPDMGLNQLFAGANLNIGILLALFCVLLMELILKKTVFGYELKVCGQNPDAGRYAGIHEKRDIVLSMMISGSLAGLGGGMLYLAGSGKYLQVLDVLEPEGFLGISVALLGRSNPIGILLAGLFIGHITVGGYNMQLFDFASEAVDMMLAVIVYCSALSLFFKNRIVQRRGRKRA